MGLSSGPGRPAHAADWHELLRVEGKWWVVGTDGNPDPTRQVIITRSDRLGDSAVPKDVRFAMSDGIFEDWEGRLNSLSGAHIALRFERRPRWNEMGENAPEAARRAVEGNLTWQLDLTFGLRKDLGLSLSGAFDRRDIHVESVKNFQRGTYEQRFTWSPSGKLENVEYIKARLPVVFVPGIAGSELVDFSSVVPNGATIWIGPYSKSALTLDPGQPHDTIVADDVLRSNLLEGYGDLIHALTNSGYREYQFADPSNRANMSRLTSAGCDIEGQKAQHPTLFIFPYDWRFSVEETAVKLKDYIACVRRFYPDGAIDIVTHSMGGLVARRYILDNQGSSGVHQLITIAAPWLGAPKAIYTMLTGDFGIPSLVAWHSTMEKLAVYFASAHELLPSRAYFDIAPSPVAQITQSQGQEVKRLLNYDEFVTWLNGLIPATSPASTGQAFHDAPGQDDWRTDNSGVEYFHIYGVQSSDATIVQVQLNRVTRCVGGSREFQQKQMCVTVVEPKPVYGKGDGTVPAESASRQGKSDLNFKGVRVQRVTCLNQPALVLEDDRCSHTGLVRNEYVHLLVLNALGVN